MVCDAPAPRERRGLMCFGHPLLDMMATVSADFLEKHKVVPGSVSLATPEQEPVFSEIVEREEGGVEYVPGGAAMNTARTFAWILPGVSVSYVGALGRDRFSEILRQSVSNAGVSALFEEHIKKPTGTCAGLVLNKDRALLANLGSAVELSMDHMLSETVQTALAEASLYYSEGFFLNTRSSPDNLMHVAHHAHRYGKLFCFNLNAPYICHAFTERIQTLLPHIDILFGSDEDVLAFAAAAYPAEFDLETLEPKMGMGPLREEALVTTLRRLSMLPTVNQAHSRVVVATCGACDTYVARDGRVTSYAVPPMTLTEMVDVNGAGDSFVAGFLSQYASNGDIAMSAAVGHFAAQTCIRHSGANISGEPPLIASAQ